MNGSYGPCAHSSLLSPSSHLTLSPTPDTSPLPYLPFPLPPPPQVQAELIGVCLELMAAASCPWMLCWGWADAAVSDAACHAVSPSAPHVPPSLDLAPELVKFSMQGLHSPSWCPSYCQGSYGALNSLNVFELSYIT